MGLVAASLDTGSSGRFSNQIAWVYSIVDRNPNGLVGLDQVPGLQQGAQLLLRGLWHVEKQSITFDEDHIYHLQGSNTCHWRGRPAAGAYSHIAADSHRVSRPTPWHRVSRFRKVSDTLSNGNHRGRFS